MRPLVALMTVCIGCIQLAGAADPAAPLTPAASAEVRSWQPESSFFFINGLAYRYAAGPSYAVIAAATPGVAGKYLGVKLHVFNRGHRSITVRPEDVVLLDAVANRRLASIPAVAVVNRKTGTPAWAKVAGMAAGPPPEPLSDLMDPHWSGLARALQPEVKSSARPEAGAGGAAGENLQVDAPDCDTGCQLRNREANSRLSSGGQESLADSIQRTAFLANTIPPQCDVEGILYFPMPKQAGTEAAARRRSKSYAVTLEVSLAGERFLLDFPVE